MPAYAFQVSSIDLEPATLSPAERLGIEHHRRAGFSILCHEDESPVGSLVSTGLKQRGEA